MVVQAHTPQDIEALPRGVRRLHCITGSLTGHTRFVWPLLAKASGADPQSTTSSVSTTPYSAMLSRDHTELRYRPFCPYSNRALMPHSLQLEPTSQSLAAASLSKMYLNQAVLGPTTRSGCVISVRCPSS